jgi:hypothetical protein
MRTATLLLLVFSFLLLRCKKESCCKCSASPQWIEAVLPDTVSLGGTLVYLNGEEIDFEPNMVAVKRLEMIGYSFLQVVEDIESAFAFGNVPLKTGYYGLHTDPQQASPDKALAVFAQIVDEDLRGYSYKLEESVEGFIHVESLDSINQVVKGRFKVAFCRTSTNGYEDLGLPEHMLLQGVFHEKYEIE